MSRKAVAKPAAKKAAKAAPAPAAAIPAELGSFTGRELKTLSEAELTHFLDWCETGASDAYYNAASPAQQTEFGVAQRAARRAVHALQDADLDQFVRSAQWQLPQLSAAVTDLRQELEGARQGADILKDATTLITLLKPFLAL